MKTKENLEGEEVGLDQDQGPKLEEEGHVQGQEGGLGLDQKGGTDHTPEIQMKNLKVGRKAKEKGQEDDLGLDQKERTDLILGVLMKSLKVVLRANISQAVAPRVKIKEAIPSQVQDLSQDLDPVTKRFICEKRELHLCLYQNRKFIVYVCIFL